VSYKCKYVYVQGLRFRPEDVTVFWEQSDGTRRPYGLAIGYMKLGPNNELLTLLPSETKAAVKRGETMEAHVRLSNGETVVLRLDPWKLGGRKGRRSFDAGSLAGLSLRARRALALEQLKTAPYGSKNRHEAVERMLWSIDVLNDEDIVSMLLHASPLTKPYEGRSSSPVELAALLASDKRIIRAMLAKTTTGPGRSTELLREMAAQATAELAYIGTSWDDMCADIVWNDEDPDVRVAAVRHMSSQSTLAKIALSDQDWPIRLAAVEGLAARVVDIDNLCLSTKLADCLRRGGVHTVGDLVKLRDEDLLALPDFNTGSLWEVRSTLAAWTAANDAASPESGLLEWTDWWADLNRRLPHWQHIPKSQRPTSAHSHLPDNSVSGDGHPAGSGRDLFEHLATTDSNASIRQAAVEKVASHATLQSVAESDENSSVRERAIARLFVTHRDVAQQFIAMRAAEDPSRSVRAAAAACVEDYGVLVGVLDRAHVAAGGAEFSTEPVVDELLSRIARGPADAYDRTAGVVWHTPEIYKSLRGETINEFVDDPADTNSLCTVVYHQTGLPGGSVEAAIQPKGPAIELAKVRDAEVCKRLLAELAAKSEASSQYDLTVAVHAVEALKDNPALPNELYTFATDLSARLRAAEREAHFRERDVRGALRKDSEMRVLKEEYNAEVSPVREGLGLIGTRTYPNPAAGVEAIVSHLRRGDFRAAQRALDDVGSMGPVWAYRPVLHAAAVSLSDPGQIRELVEVVLPRLHDGSLSLAYHANQKRYASLTEFARDEWRFHELLEYAYPTQDADLARRFMDFVCANPATPSDILEIQISRSRDLDDHLWRDLLEHPNATPGQRARVAELRAAAAAARERDRPL